MSLSNLTTTAPSIRRRCPAWLLPLALLVGFASLFLFILRHELLPIPTVQTARAEYAVETTDTSPIASQEKRATLLFRATGWIGADPLPAAATTYIPGRVAEVLVVEGELVQQGQVIARLDAAEYELALAQAEGNLQAAEAHAAAVEATLAEARATLAALSERMENLARRHARLDKLQAAASEQQREDARYELTEYRARTEAQEHALAAAEHAAKQAHAMATGARATRDMAALNLSRCAITAPITGRIQKLNAVPGGRLSPGGETVDMSTAAILYDPQQLALAADVPLDQAGQLSVGQQVRISCDTFPQKEFVGHVARIYGQADQTRNTIRCQVSIENPEDMLRPDMQCRGAFYSDGAISADVSSEEESQQKGSAGDLVRVPEAAILGDAVWVVLPEGLLQKRSIVRVGDKVRGVLPGEPVVLNPASDIKEGQRVKIQK